MTITTTSQTKSLQYYIRPIIRTFSGYKRILMDKLGELEGIDGEVLFEEVYGVEKTQLTSYPACFVIQRESSGQLIDTHRNEREWRFSVVLHQEIGTKTPEEAYKSLEDAVDRVIKMFDQDPMLRDSGGGSQCKFVRVAPVNFEYGSRESAVHRALLVVSVVELVQRYS